MNKSMKLKQISNKNNSKNFFFKKEGKLNKYNYNNINKINK